MVWAVLDYPKTVTEFAKQFPDEKSCWSYLKKIRWPSGFECPRCRCQRHWTTTRGLWVCRNCDYQASLLTGTIFQDSRLPLRKWFEGIWYLIHQKTGVSASGLQKVLGLGSYQTAWLMLHKLRKAMVRPNREKLHGEVEVDETIVGGKRSGRRGRDSKGNPLVVIAAEQEGKKIGRIRMQYIPDASSETLEAFVRENVERGSQITTDQWKGYNGLGKRGYRHQTVPGSKVGEQEVLPRVHLVASLLKRWLLGTHQGRVKRKMLQAYLDEFAFRFNRRTSGSRGLLFKRILENVVALQPVPLKKLSPKPSKG